MSRPFQIRPRNNVFVIVDPSGRRLLFEYDQLSAAQDEVALQLDDMTARRAQKQRSCLCCDAPFHSQGPHNRLCDDCRKKRDPLGADQSLPQSSQRRQSA